MTKTYEPIQVGDTVVVRSGMIIHCGEVMYAPASSGDSWHILNDKGRIVYIQSFDYMEKMVAQSKPMMSDEDLAILIKAAVFLEMFGKDCSDECAEIREGIRNIIKYYQP